MVNGWGRAGADEKRGKYIAENLQKKCLEWERQRRETGSQQKDSDIAMLSTAAAVPGFQQSSNRFIGRCSHSKCQRISFPGGGYYG